MATHILSLEVPDTMNKCILRIVDMSVYNSLNPATCQLLQITLPGFNIPVQLSSTDIDLGFSVNLTACDLDLQTVNCGTSYTDLPDGIYVIKYSVSPNEIVYVEYNHLRITNALYIIQCLLCYLDVGTCEPTDEIRTKLNELTLIKRYLDAAKAQVEYCHHPSKGMELYRYVIKRLNKLACNTNCGTCSTC